MASTFPGAIDSFVLNVDGVDDALAADMNLAQDAAVAIENVLTKLGRNLLPDSLTYANAWLAGTTFADFTDDTYGPTLWNMIHNGNPPDVAQQAGGATDPFTGYFRCTMDTAATQAGIIHFIEAQTAKALRGQPVAISADVWGTNVTNIRMAVLEWTSTADTLTSDVVNGWITGSPTLATNWAYVGTPASIAITSTRTRYSVPGLTLGSTFNNLAVFIWTPDSEASGDLFNVARVKLELGLAATEFVARTNFDELMGIKYFYQKSFNNTTAPAQNVGINTGEMVYQAITAGASSKPSPFFPWTPFMFITPHTVTFFNPAAANALVRDSVAAADGGAPATVATERGIRVAAAGNAATAISNSLHVHFTADARL